MLSHGQREKSSQSNKSKTRRSNRTRNDHGGMHQRRDKRRPFYVSSRDKVEAVSGQLQMDATNTAVAAVRRSSEPDSIEPWRRPLQTWLDWNKAYERATACMSMPGQSLQRVEDMMDRIDDVRREAVRMSETLLRQ